MGKMFEDRDFLEVFLSFFELQLMKFDYIVHARIRLRISVLNRVALIAELVYEAIPAPIHTSNFLACHFRIDPNGRAIRLNSELRLQRRRVGTGKYDPHS